jgi:hypothetical protein
MCFQGEKPAVGDRGTQAAGATRKQRETIARMEAKKNLDTTQRRNLDLTPFGRPCQRANYLESFDLQISIEMKLGKEVAR